MSQYYYEGDDPEQARRRPYLIALTLVFGIVAVVIWRWPGMQAPHPELKDSYQFIAPFTSIEAIGDGGWIARLPSTWVTEHAREAAAVCKQLQDVLKPTGVQTITLLAETGDVVLAECP